MARVWEPIFLIATAMVYLSGCAPSRTWINYGPVKTNEWVENSAVSTFDTILSESKKASYEIRQGHGLRSGVKTLHQMDGSSSLLTKQDNTLSYTTPFAPVTSTVRKSSPSTFVRVISQSNSTQQLIPWRNVSTKMPNRMNPTRWPTFDRTSSTSSTTNRRGSSVLPFPTNPKQVLQKPLSTNAQKEISNVWIPLHTTTRPISQAGIKTNPTTAFPVPPRTRATPKPTTKTPSGSGKGSQVTGSSNKPGNSSLINPSTIIVVPPFVASCPDGQKADDLGICREEFR